MLDLLRFFLVGSVFFSPVFSSAAEGQAVTASKGASALLSPGDLIYLGAFAAPESVVPPDYSEWGDTAIHVWQVRAALFADGFESGDTDRWSVVAPGEAGTGEVPAPGVASASAPEADPR